ncbi:MAG: RDD family protein [Methanomassiliicoccus sp.]|nr:RDD family protein [Methanomassiliicoccus sp.]
MHTGFDILESSSALRRHWLRRFIAGIVDIVLVFVPTYYALRILDVTNTTIVAGLGAGLVWFLYAGLFEGRFGRTLGKALVRQKVVSMGERRRYKQTFIRSIPKLFWYIFLPFDVAVGLATEGDPRKRWSDGLAHTLVIAYYPAVPRSKKVPQARPRMQRKDEYDL